MYGFIDTKGVMAKGFFYSDAKDFSEGLAAVKQESSWFFVNQDFEQAFPGKFDDVLSFSEGIASVKIDEKWGAIDRNGEMLIEPQYDVFDQFHDGRARVEKGRWGLFIDTNNETIFGYDRTPTSNYQFSDGFVNIIGEMHDVDGNPVFEEWDTEYYNFHHGLCKVKISGGYGYINSLGELIIPGPFKNAGDFSYGLAAVIINNKPAYIDTNGEIIIPPSDVIEKEEYTLPWFSDDCVFIGINNLWDGLEEYNGWRLGYLNRNGDIIWRSDVAWAVWMDKLGK